MDEKDQPRFNIVNAFAETFKGLPESIETNLHRASRCGDCIWVSVVFCFSASLGERSNCFSCFSASLGERGVVSFLSL